MFLRSKCLKSPDILKIWLHYQHQGSQWENLCYLLLSVKFTPTKSLPGNKKNSNKLKLFPWGKKKKLWESFFSPSYNLLLWGLTYFLPLSFLNSQLSLGFLHISSFHRIHCVDCQLPWQAGAPKTNSVLNKWQDYVLHWALCSSSFLEMSHLKERKNKS